MLGTVAASGRRLIFISPVVSLNLDCLLFFALDCDLAARFFDLGGDVDPMMIGSIHLAFDDHDFILGSLLR